MNELIKITEKEGKQLVSAKELHTLLKYDSSNYAKWAKRNIVDNIYSTENEDWIVFVPQDENPNGGRPTVDYALTITFAKKLAMMSKTEEGNKVRDYFIECEKTAKENNPKTLSQIEILVQSAQMLLEQERRISSVENKLERMEQERIENTTKLLSAPISTEKVPELSLRNNIRQLVNKYANATGIKQQDVWHKIYHQLYYLYNININAYKVQGKETKLDVAERNMFLDKMFIVISNMVQELK